MSEEDTTKQVIDFVSEISNDVKDRLKNYDEKFNGMISNLDKELESTKKESKQELGKINELLLKGVEDLKTSLSSAIANIQNEISETKVGIKKDYTDVTDNLTTKITSIEAVADKLSNEITQKDETLRSSIQEFEKTLKEDIVSNSSELEENLKKHINDMDSQNKEKINSSNLKIQELETSLGAQIKDISEQTTNFSTNTSSRFDNIMEKLLEVKETFDKNLEDTNIKNQDKIDKYSESAENKFSNINNLVSQVKEEINKQMGIIKLELEKKFSDLLKQQKQFFSITQNHSEGILSLTDVLEDIRGNYLKNFGEIKDDQKNMMESFKKIIVGSSENLRNEVIVFSKEVQRQLSGFEKDSKTNFLLKTDGEAIDEKVKTLDRDLRQKAETIRTDLVQSLDENVRKFDSAVKDSLNEVHSVKLELERYKDEIESMIERKVNEKFEFVQEILSNVVIKSETLSTLIKDSKIKGPEVVKVPVEKGSERLEEE
ncbi:MAG: hypothetical protein ACW981_00345 [Candidatus Hodarchaeales archaeon]|jgi:gas vesicle protein